MKPNEISPQLPDLADPKLRAYYGNRPLMWRNLSFILLLNLGWAVSFTVVGPLMQLKVNEAGLHEGGIGLVASINSWACAFLVIYFGWKSDHTVTRFGRRIPYLFISAPFIVLAVIFFPFVEGKGLLIALWLMQMLFTDIKASTIPLLNIDCMPRQLLARMAAPSAILTAVVTFFALRYGMSLAETAEWLPYILASTILVLTTLIGGFLIKEPPVYNPTQEKFRPWSTMKVAWKDKRKIVQMLSCSMFQTFQVVFASWIWLYGVNKLGLSRGEIAQAMSWSILCGVLAAFPMSWLVDRISPYRLLPFFGLASLVVLLLFLNIKDVNGLILATCFQAVFVPLYGSADIMVYRTADPADVGSVTSTNSCLRMLYIGGVSLAMGGLIQVTGGSYHWAYVVAWILTVLALVPLYIYRHLMRVTGHVHSGSSLPETGGLDIVLPVKK